MTVKEKKHALDYYLTQQKAKTSMSLLYRYLEFYDDELNLDVENCNLVHSRIHQTGMHNVGFSYKKASTFQLDKEQVLYKIQ